MKIKDRIAYTAISKAMRAACGMGISDLNLSSFLVSMNEVDRAAVLVEKDDGQHRDQPARQTGIQCFQRSGGARAAEGIRWRRAQPSMGRWTQQRSKCCWR